MGSRRVLGGNEKLTSGRFEGEAVSLNRDRVLRSPELRENVGHSRNPKKSVMDQAEDAGKSFSPLYPQLAFPLLLLQVSSTTI